ncbi:MAG: S-layer homology domain-containing protein [Anaerolineales bacterium]|nr:S-layer homology domain-containing protein [Anaerolineales bacterium]
MVPKYFSNSICLAIILTLCLTAVPAPVFAASSRVESVVVNEHVIKFYLDPALVPDVNFAKAVLGEYVHDMNVILAKNTSRRLIFNPETDIILTNTQPHSNQATPPLPVEDFEIWAHAIRTDYSTSYGGYAGIDDGGAGVLAGLKWTKLYDPNSLSADEVVDYWTQINNMLHELAHVFGAGYGEYYKLTTIQDSTGVAPLLNINILNQNDAFWSDKPDFMTDPLLKNAAQAMIAGQPANRANLLDYVEYSKLTAKIISSDYRNGSPTIDLSQINIKVVSTDGQPLNEAKVDVWSVFGGSPYSTQLMVDDLTNENGEIGFSWGGLSNPHNSYDFLRLIKVYKEGYVASARYFSIFDADIEKLVNGNDFLTITIQLGVVGANPPSTSTFEDVDVNAFASSSIEQLYNAEITGGCSLSPLLYCPNDIVTRGQMAVFLERSMKGSGFSPSVGTLSFNDTADHWARYWIEVLAVDGVTSGCGNGNYCPDSPVTRAQMAVFLLRAKHGADYAPSAPSGLLFQDVPADYWAAAWVEQFSTDGITSGCGNGNYCPDEPVTRAQMAVFLTRAFDLIP